MDEGEHVELRAGGLERRARPRRAEDVLGWAARRHAPRIAFATGFGAEGCVIVDLIARLGLPIEILTLDTGLFFPETYELWRTLERRYGLVIRAVRPEQDVAQQAAQHGPRLWERDPDRCCALRKLAPLERELRGLSAWVTAIRRDQAPARAQVDQVERDQRFGLVKVNPLAHWTESEVWSHLRQHDVPVNPLHRRGYRSIGCQPCTSPVAAGEHARAGRWRGHSKLECGLHLPRPAVTSLERGEP